jgi:hypothetical protein
MRRRIYLLLAALVAVSVWALWPKTPRDVQAFVIYSCNDLTMMGFVKSDYSIEAYAVESYDQTVAFLERAERIPQDRKYFFNIARHCPYTRRTT